MVPRPSAGIRRRPNKISPAPLVMDRSFVFWIVPRVEAQLHQLFAHGQT